MNINDIKIIKLKPGDWLKHKGIRLEALKRESQAFNSTYEESINHPNKYWVKKLGDKNEIHLFALYENKIIGTINATLREENVKEDTAVVHETYVNILFRKKGVGKLLIDSLLKEIKKNKRIRKIKLWVKETQLSARNLYESVGFSFTERAGKHTLIMEKSLTE